MGQKTKSKEDYEKKKKAPGEGGFQPAKPWEDYRGEQKPERTRKPAAAGSEPGSGIKYGPREYIDVETGARTIRVRRRPVLEDE